MRKETVIKRIEEIADGWRNLMIKDAAAEKFAKERAGICAECDNYGTKLGVPVCNHCNCVLSAKTRSSLASCPIRKW